MSDLLRVRKWLRRRQAPPLFLDVSIDTPAAQRLAFLAQEGTPFRDDRHE